VVSDGAQGLLSYLRQSLPAVYQQRCVFHTWRNLGRELARQTARAAQGLSGEEAAEARRRQTLDANSFEEAEQALAQLRVHPRGARLGKILNERFIESLAHLLPANCLVGRVVPEWCWRDFRLRSSRGRNHGSERRLFRAGLVFSIYHNFTTAQDRREHKRHYRHPGQSPLGVAGLSLEGCSYLDALEV